MALNYNIIPNGWRRTRLGDIVNLNYGKSLPEKKRLKGNVPVFSSAGITGWHNEALVNSKGIIIGRKGTIGKVYKSDIPFYPIDTTYYILPNEKYDFDFLYYLLLNLNLEELNEDSAVPGLNRNTAYSLEIIIPESINEQRAIASVLSSLDDKIDLLHRQNKTLEAMAEALFRKWFIEEAKEDWEYNTLENYVKVYRGVSYKSSELNNSKVALVTLKNFGRDGSLRFDGFKEYTGKYKEEQVVNSGDLVVAQTDITQNADIIGNPLLIFNLLGYEKLIISTDVLKIEPKNDWFSKEFLYYLMRTRLFKEHCIGFSNGSTVLHLSKDAIPNFDFFVPPKEKIVFFTKKVKGFIDKINVNLIQIRTLEKLRDTLLPKLMSGEVRVKF
ncbi:type I restriction enzyme, S subunit [Desulfonauticus submarinus]|uniref:Type I restriction enzyme, S subunit n=1 Tax=Desulfonauticus submarinus TaxID=206665 RepID=A0A1H0A343_9BACT|nr:restriction endonuclease subunit S [Desulfonauticus submarinus]SDN27684.1 type I restriction enzyme, S subunit [Desulfonauticus submarinus]